MKKCHRCGSRETIRYWHNDYDNKRNWIGHLCYNCKLDVEKEKTRKIKEKILNEKKDKKIKCVKCGNDIDIDDNKYNYYDDNGVWDKKSKMCDKCYVKDWYKETKSDALKYDTRIRKDEIYIRDFNSLTKNEIGLIIEVVVCKTLMVKHRNIESNNFRSGGADTLRHPMYGYIEVKSSSFDIERNLWHNAIENENFDTLMFVCMDMYNPWKNIERFYTIPYSELSNQVSISISKNGKKWERFRTEIVYFNNNYHGLVSYFKNRPFNIDNIKKWLND